MPSAQPRKHSELRRALDALRLFSNVILGLSVAVAVVLFFVGAYRNSPIGFWPGAIGAAVSCVVGFFGYLWSVAVIGALSVLLEIEENTRS